MREPTAYIRNYKISCIKQVLRYMGKKLFYGELKFQGIRTVPKPSDMYLAIEDNECRLYIKGEFTDHQLSKLVPEEIPLDGWQVYIKYHKKRKK